MFLQKGIEVNETTGTEMYLECMKNAQYPQRSENSQATSAVILPIHDWTSHNRTSTEYMAVNVGFEEEYEQDVEAPAPQSVFHNGLWVG